MDLGAPILDVEAAVVKSEVTTTTSSTKASAPVKIITGGVVSAPGYEPIVISNVAVAEEVEQG